MKWKRNALRHSFISYKLALMPDTARVAMECGNSPDVIFAHYRELVAPQQASEWFNVFPPQGYPQNLSLRRERGIGCKQRHRTGLRRSCLLDPIPAPITPQFIAPRVKVAA
jgi:hypothetical protein